MIGSQEVICIPPRIPYARTYVLLPPEADEAWIDAIIDSGAWDEHRWTIGGSADDAGVGPVDRQVIAINPGQWPSDLRQFFNTHYPGVRYTSVEAETPEALQRALRDF